MCTLPLVDEPVSETEFELSAGGDEESARAIAPAQPHYKSN